MFVKFRNLFSNNVMKCFSFFLCIYGVTYSLFFHNVYTSDHVMASFNLIEPRGIIHYLSGGRYVNYLIDRFYIILSKIGVTHTNNNQWVLQGVFILFLSLASKEIYMLFCEKKHNLDYKLLLLISIAFVNPFIVEHFVYHGAELGIAIWISIVGVKKFHEKKYLFSFLLVFTAVCTYQSYIALFLIYATGVWFCIYCDKMSKTAIFNYLKLLALALIAAISNVVILKLSLITGIIDDEVRPMAIISSEKGTIIGGIIGKIAGVLDTFRATMISTMNMLPKGVLVGVIIGAALLVGLHFYREKKKCVCLLIYVITILIIHLYPFALAMIMGTIYLPQRVIWPIFASCSIGLIIAYKLLKGSKYIPPFLGLVIVFGIVLFFKTQTSILDMYISNSLDYYYAEMVQEEIIEYEEESGYEITDVYVMHATDAEYCHYQLMHMDYGITYTRKIQAQSFSDVEWLNFVNDEKYIKHEMSNADQETYFKKDTASVFNASEQLHFDKNNMYWLIY